MSKCPTCFHPVPAAPELLVCVGTCATQRNDRGSAERGYEVMTRPTMSPSRKPSGEVTATCSKCSVETTQEACPRCIGQIPQNWRESKVTCVAMSGARATGKSLTLGVAKAQLDLYVQRFHRSVLRGVGDTDQEFFERYTKKLYEQREILEPTASIEDNQTTTREPLIFAFTERHSESGQSRRRVLVLRDVAGEDLEQHDNPAALSFFARADAVVVLIDPLKVPDIRNMLADVIPNDTRLGGDGRQVLDNLLRLMTGGALGGRTQVPLAVALSKFDVLQQLRSVQGGSQWAAIMNRPGSPLQRDPSLQSRGYDHNDGLLLHHEVLSLLHQLNSEALSHTLDEHADNYRYFALSALGSHPKGDQLAAGGIAPFRVLDPFKWALEVAG